MVKELKSSGLLCVKLNSKPISIFMGNYFLTWVRCKAKHRLIVSVNVNHNETQGDESASTSSPSDHHSGRITFKRSHIFVPPRRTVVVAEVQAEGMVDTDLDSPWFVGSDMHSKEVFPFNNDPVKCAAYIKKHYYDKTGENQSNAQDPPFVKEIARKIEEYFEDHPEKRVCSTTGSPNIGEVLLNRHTPAGSIAYGLRRLVVELATGALPDGLATGAGAIKGKLLAEEYNVDPKYHDTAAVFSGGVVFATLQAIRGFNRPVSPPSDNVTYVPPGKRIDPTYPKNNLNSGVPSQYQLNAPDNKDSYFGGPPNKSSPSGGGNNAGNSSGAGNNVGSSSGGNNNAGNSSGGSNTEGSSSGGGNNAGSSSGGNNNVCNSSNDTNNTTLKMELDCHPGVEKESHIPEGAFYAYKPETYREQTENKDSIEKALEECYTVVQKFFTVPSSNSSDDESIPYRGAEHILGSLVIAFVIYKGFFYLRK